MALPYAARGKHPRSLQPDPTLASPCKEGSSVSQSAPAKEASSDFVKEVPQCSVLSAHGVTTA